MRLLHGRDGHSGGFLGLQEEYDLDLTSRPPEILAFYPYWPLSATLTQVLLNHCIICQRDGFILDLGLSTFQDEFPDRLQIWKPMWDQMRYSLIRPRHTVWHCHSVLQPGWGEILPPSLLPTKVSPASMMQLGCLKYTSEEGRKTEWPWLSN